MSREEVLSVRCVGFLYFIWLALWADSMTAEEEKEEATKLALDFNVLLGSLLLVTTITNNGTHHDDNDENHDTASLREKFP